MDSTIIYLGFSAFLYRTVFHYHMKKVDKHADGRLLESSSASIPPEASAKSPDVVALVSETLVLRDDGASTSGL